MITSINLAYYKEKDWERLLAASDDRESMDDTWKDWHQAYLKTKRLLIAEGVKVHVSVVDIDELLNYCKRRGIKNDGSARSQFVIKK